MEYRGSSVYEQEDFLSNYLKRRNRQDSPNNAIEAPIIFELLEDVSGKAILDLGCGDASFGRELLKQGAQSYSGVEGSEQMMNKARKEMEGLGGTLYQMTMEAYPFPANDVDIVTSRFAIHYIKEIEQLFKNIHRTLKEGGKFVFSVQHPLTTSSFESKKTGGKRGSWIVDDYFLEGERKEPWIDKMVVKYHRTIEHYFAALTRAGFKITDLREGLPQRQHFSAEEEFQRRNRIPVVLIFSCTK